MIGCVVLGDIVWYFILDNVKCKYVYIWELIEIQQGVVICVNMLCVNFLVKEVIFVGIIFEFLGYNQLKSEVKYGEENSCIDIMLQVDD